MNYATGPLPAAQPSSDDPDEDREALPAPDVHLRTRLADRRQGRQRPRILLHDGARPGFLSPAARRRGLPPSRCREALPGLRHRVAACSSPSPRRLREAIIPLPVDEESIPLDLGWRDAERS